MRYSKLGSLSSATALQQKPPHEPADALHSPANPEQSGVLSCREMETSACACSHLIRVSTQLPAEEAKAPEYIDTARTNKTLHVMLVYQARTRHLALWAGNLKRGSPDAWEVWSSIARWGQPTRV